MLRSQASFVRQSTWFPETEVCNITTTLPGEIYELYDQQKVKYLSVLYLNFAKAFDGVPHDILLQEVKKFWHRKILFIIDSVVSDQPRRTCPNWRKCIKS